MNKVTEILFKKLFLGMIVMSSLMSFFFWALALLGAQEQNVSFILALGSFTRIKGEGFPMRVLAMNGHKRSDKLLGGEVKSLVDPSLSLKIGEKGLIQIPAEWPSGRVQITGKIKNKRAFLEAEIPSFNDEKDVFLHARNWQEELTKGGTNERAVYPFYGSARSSLETHAVLVETDENVLPTPQIEVLRPQVIWTSLQNGSRIRTVRTREIIKLKTLEVKSSLQGTIVSQEAGAVFVDLYVNGKLFKMDLLRLIVGNNPFQIRIAHEEKFPKDALLTLRISRSFAQRDSGALAFARVNASNASLPKWASQIFLARKGEQKDPLLRVLMSSDVYLLQNKQETFWVQALLARLSSEKWALNVLSPSLKEQRHKRNERRFVAVKHHQIKFRFTAVYSLFLFILGLRTYLREEKNEKIKLFNDVLQSDGAHDIEKSVYHNEEISNLVGNKKGEQFLFLFISSAALGVLFVLDWILSALAQGIISL